MRVPYRTVPYGGGVSLLLSYEYLLLVYSCVAFIP